jgi:hypothetical protein
METKITDLRDLKQISRLQQKISDIASWNAQAFAVAAKNLSGQKYIDDFAKLPSVVQEFCNKYESEWRRDCAYRFVGKPEYIEAILLLNQNEKPEIFGEIVTSCVRGALIDGNLGSLKMIFDTLGVSPNAIITANENALSMAFLSGNLVLMSFLIESGASVNGRTASGLTTLHYCEVYYDLCAESIIPWVEFLINRGADVNAKDKDGQTPLDYIVESRFCKTKASQELIDFLRRKGAKTCKEL